jgi:hypothetical protein
MDVARYLAKYKKLKPGSEEYNDFMSELDALGILGIPLPTEKMPKFTPKYYTAQFIEEREAEFEEGVLKSYLAIAIQISILKHKSEKSQFEVVEGSIVEEYLKTLESEFEPLDEKTLSKLYTELTRKPRKQSEGAEDETAEPDLEPAFEPEPVPALKKK